LPSLLHLLFHWFVHLHSFSDHPFTINFYQGIYNLCCFFQP
jgi:hypothetical protein